MKRTLTAVHDAPVLRSPGPGLPARIEIARVATPVAFDWVDAHIFDRGERHPTPGWVGQSIQPWLRDGVAWHPVGHLDAKGRPTARAVHPDELCEWLAGEADPDEPYATALARAFSGSPLAPRPIVPAFGKGARGLRRQAAFDPDAAAGIVGDDREACAAEVRRIVSEEIVVAEGTVLARFRPMLRYYVDGKSAHERMVLAPEATVSEPVLRVSRRYDASGMMHAHIHFSDRVMPLAKVLPGLDHDGDLRVMANVLPASIRIGLARAASGVQELPRNRSVESVRAADAAMAVLERRGAFGLIGADEVPAAMEAMRDAARLVSQVADRGIPATRYAAFARAHEYVNRAIAERIPNHATDDDAFALETLAP